MTAAPTNPLPPRWAEWLAGFRLPADRREFVLGDLDEEFAERSRRQGARAATRWYWRQAWRTLFGRHPQTFHDPDPQHDPRSPRTMPSLMPDLRYAIRGLRRQPGFALAAVLTLALGIGANAAVFRVAWHVILQPLPFPNADRLVRVSEEYVRNGRALTNPVAPGNFADWQRDTRSFAVLGAYTMLRNTLDLTETGDPRQLETEYVTPEFFHVFEMSPLAGRLPLPQDVSANAAAPVVLSEHLWRSTFGADRAAVGSTIRLSGASHEVVGVMPEAFAVAGGATTDLWMVNEVSPQARSNHGGHYFAVVGRLEPGVTVAQAILDVKAAALADSLAYPASNKDTSATVESMSEARGGTIRPSILLLVGAAGFVLLIACANLASLQLARGLSRAREFGIRTALGASRGRLVRQLIVEGTVLSVLGGITGLLLSSWILGILARVAPPSIRAGAAAGLDGAALACAGALGIVSVMLFASLPAWRAANRATAWATQRSSTGDRHTSRIRTVLVTGQLALATMLAVSATLLVTSLALVMKVDPGFDESGVLAFDLTMPYAYADRDLLFQNVSREISALPGVAATCAINVVPFDQSFNMTYVPQRPDGPGPQIGAYPRTVTPGCFDVLRLRLVAGRTFTDHESARVGIITESFARRAFGDSDPVGQHVHLGVADGALIEIVGVVADSLQVSLETRPYPQFYEVASAQSAFLPQSVLVRTRVAPSSLFAAVRAAVRRVDPSQPVARLRTLESIVGTSTSERRFELGLFLGFAVIALVLAAVGTYGLFAQVVAERRAEISIRMALGALPGMAVRLILRRAWLAIAAGLAIGLTGAILSAETLRHLLFGLSATDPRVYTGVAIVLGTVALIAAWIPSRRAALVEPVEAIKGN